MNILKTKIRQWVLGRDVFFKKIRDDMFEESWLFGIYLVFSSFYIIKKKKKKKKKMLDNTYGSIFYFF